jgi:transcriptional regulator with XRE-family HTH domain
VDYILITPAQCRMARSLLNWTQTELAEKCELAPMTITKFEKEGSDKRPEARTLEKIRQAFEMGGVEFLPNEGVCKASNQVLVLKGHDGFTRFRELVLNRAKQGPLEVCVSNVDERNFSRWGGEDMNNNYRKELVKLGTVHFKIIIKEGDYNLTATKFAEYRCVPEQEFGEVPFYIFDDNLVLIPFEEDEMNLFIIKNALLAKYYQKQFEVSWAKAQPVKA